MKKMVLTDFDHIELLEAPIPVPGPGQAVLRVKYAGICGSDLHVFTGLHPTAKPPLVMGHEACATVHAINSSRSDIKIGDKVCCHTIVPCYTCDNCNAGRENLCASVKIMGTNFDGVFSQYVLVNANRVIKFNDNVADTLAALVEPVTVGIHDLKRANLHFGENVLIGGAGPISLILAILAKHSGAAHVILTEIDPTRIRIAKEMGFVAINPTEDNLKKVCTENCIEEGFDKAFEVSSAQSSFDICTKYLKRGGTLIQVGMPPAGKIFNLNINKFIYSECTLLGVRHHTMADMQAAVRLINSGVLNHQFMRLISAIYPLERSSEAFERARTDKSVLRVLIDFDS